MTRFSIFDNTTHKRVSPDAYATADEANHDYYMNAGHTHVAPMPMSQQEALQEARRRVNRAVGWDELKDALAHLRFLEAAFADAEQKEASA